MTENEKKLNPVYHARVSNPPGKENEDFIVTSPGSSKKCLNKYELTIEIPNVDRMLAENAPLSALFEHSFFKNRGLSPKLAVHQLARKISTGPAFDTCFDKKADPIRTPDPTGGEDYIDYPLVENGHQKLQELMDSYEMGRKESAGPSIKRKAAELDAQTAAAKEAGFESIAAMIEFYKGGGKKGKK